LRNAGAAILGKTNMTEFAFSGLGINPHYGTPINPADNKVQAKPTPGGLGGVKKPVVPVKKPLGQPQGRPMGQDPVDNTDYSMSGE
jgi:hypothetical protein